MTRFLIGFLIAALIFNTPATIGFFASVAQVAKLVYIRAEAAGEEVWQQIDAELVKRDVLVPQHQRCCQETDVQGRVP